MKRQLARLGLSLLVTVALHSVTTAAPSPQRADEIANLKWGMFVCWSFSSFSGIEWTTQPHGPEFFAATDCDVDQWCRVAKAAQMNYILFLAKHHDGFCLWDTQTTDLKVTRSPIKRDVLADLRKACDRHGLKLALYFSEGEWRWPNTPDGKRLDNNGGYNPEMKKAQLKELLTQYGPIEYIWFDHAIGDGGLSHKDTDEWIYKFQPQCLPGYNHGQPAGAIRLGEMGSASAINDPSGAPLNSQQSAYTGYIAAEFTYPILPPHSGGAAWFYSLPKHDGLCHPASKLYADYLKAVQHRNIFSINIGPNAQGKLREIDIQTLTEVGRLIRTQAPAPSQN